MMGTTSVFANVPRVGEVVVKYYAEYMNVTLNNLYTSYYTQRFSKGGPLKRGELKYLMAQNRVDCEEHPPLEPLTPIGIGHIEPTTKRK